MLAIQNCPVLFTARRTNADYTNPCCLTPRSAAIDQDLGCGAATFHGFVKLSVAAICYVHAYISDCKNLELIIFQNSIYGSINKRCPSTHALPALQKE